MKKVISKVLGRYLNLINAISSKIGGKHAFYIFCFPFRAKLRSHQQRFLSTGLHFDLQVEGNEVRYYKWGVGDKKLLLVHGWQSNSFRWKKLIEALDLQEFTVFAFDAPGHGNSDGKISNVPLFERSIYHLVTRYGKVDAIVSHSIGAFASLYFVDKNPNLQPTKFVALASPGKVEDFIAFYANQLHLNSKTLKNFRHYFSEYVGQDIGYFHIKNMLGNMTAKGLIIHDIYDEATCYLYSEQIHELWKDSDLVLTSGLGHRLNSPEVIQTVKQFLAS